MHFSDLGKHCAEPTCRQVDFLPYTCKYCTKVFCTDHRSETGHNCENKNHGNIVSIKCPICLKVINYDSGLTNEHEVWTQHHNTECNPANYAPNSRVERIQSCPVKGCKTKLNSINTYQCKDCYQQLCLVHRFSDMHQCVEGKPKDDWIFAPKHNPTSPPKIQGTLPQVNTYTQENVYTNYTQEPLRRTTSTEQARANVPVGNSRPPPYLDADYIRRRQQADERANDFPAPAYRRSNVGSRGAQENIFTKVLAYVRAEWKKLEEANPAMSEFLYIFVGIFVVCIFGAIYTLRS